MRLEALILLLLVAAVNAEEGSGAKDNSVAVEGSGSLLEGSGEGSGEDGFSGFDPSQFASMFTKKLLGVFFPSYKYVRPLPDGKKMHDLRTFVNVTMDWSARRYAGKESLTIPACHEPRIRKSYYQPGGGGIMGFVDAGIGGLNDRTGHLVYPFVITVINGTQPAQTHYAVGIHKLFASQDSYMLERVIKGTFRSGPEPRKILVELALVEEVTWKKVWDRWAVASEEGLNICDGGRHFDMLLPQIHSEMENLPKYHELVGMYTDATSDVCGATSCGCPVDQKETLTFAYPTEEGLEQKIKGQSMLFAALLRGKGDMSEPLRGKEIMFQSEANSRLKEAVYACYSKVKQSALELFEEEDGDAEDEMKANYCIFYEPYC